MAALAREAGLHPVSFARAFRVRYRVSPGELMRQLRIEWAADELVRRPAQSIAAIAAEAGFYDQSHFARVFASAMGRTPVQHRRAIPATATR
jgi:AraC family transcriptional regulator